MVGVELLQKFIFQKKPEALESIATQPYLTNSFVLERWESSRCKNAHLYKNLNPLNLLPHRLILPIVLC
jgi:hypothetical protein